MWSHSKQLARKVLAVLGLYFIVFVFFKNVSQHLLHHLPLPQLTLSYDHPRYNTSKLALLIENRPLGHLAPLLLHFISVLPPDWTFLFLGSELSIPALNISSSIRRQVNLGKLELKYLPENVSVGGQEEINRFFTNLWVYENLLPRGAEWLLVFQSDSIICANYPSSIDAWLEYAYVGAPWNTDSLYGGNGGLSLRRVSSIVTVLRHQERADYSEPEDVWLTERLGHLPGVQVANGSKSREFSVEGIWWDEPFGYHTGGSGTVLSGGVWGEEGKREAIYAYCPEVKIVVEMDLRDVMGERCESEWQWL